MDMYCFGHWLNIPQADELLRRTGSGRATRETVKRLLQLK